MSTRTENALGSEARDGLMAPAAVSLVDAISAATTSASVGLTGKRLPEVVTELVRARLAPLEVTRVVTDVIDAMTGRLIDLAIAECGEPPVPWAWLALGSAARREQGIGTDQDHALAYDHQGRPLDELDGYFRHVAEYVTSGLEGAGIPRCNADVVAVNQALRQPLEHWVEAFEAWMSDPRIEFVRRPRSCSITVAWPARWTWSGRSSAPSRPHPSDPRSLVASRRWREMAARGANSDSLTGST